MSLVLPCFLPLTYSTRLYTDRGQNTRTNLLYADTNTHTHTRSHTSMHAQSQTPQCLVQNGLIAGLITKETGTKRAPGRDRLAFSIEDPTKLSGRVYRPFLMKRERD